MCRYVKQEKKTTPQYSFVDFSKKSEIYQGRENLVGCSGVILGHSNKEAISGLFSV